MRDSMVFYGGWLTALEELEPEDFKSAALAILRYGIRGEESADSGFGQFALNMARGQIDKNNQRYENGKKGGKPVQNLTEPNQDLTKANQTLTKANQTEPKHEKAEPNDNVNDNVNVNANYDSSVSNETDSPSGEGAASKQPARPNPDFVAVIDKWNTLVSYGITKITTVTPGTNRHSCLKKRLSDYGLNGIIAGIEEIPKSKFLMGKTGKRPFIITFDWFIAPNNFQKVKDGNYRDSEYRERGNEDYGGGGSSFWDEYERYKAGVECG